MTIDELHAIDQPLVSSSVNSMGPGSVCSQTQESNQGRKRKQADKQPPPEGSGAEAEDNLMSACRNWHGHENVVCLEKRRSFSIDKRNPARVPTFAHHDKSGPLQRYLKFEAGGPERRQPDLADAARRGL